MSANIVPKHQLPPYGSYETYDINLGKNLLTILDSTKSNAVKLSEKYSGHTSFPWQQQRSLLSIDLSVKSAAKENSANCENNLPYSEQVFTPKTIAHIMERLEKLEKEQHSYDKLFRHMTKLESKQDSIDKALELNSLDMDKFSRKIIVCESKVAFMSESVELLRSQPSNKTSNFSYEIKLNDMATQLDHFNERLNCLLEESNAKERNAGMLLDSISAERITPIITNQIHHAVKPIHQELLSKLQSCSKELQILKKGFDGNMFTAVGAELESPSGSLSSLLRDLLHQEATSLEENVKNSLVVQTNKEIESKITSLYPSILYKIQADCMERVESRVRERALEVGDSAKGAVATLQGELTALSQEQKERNKQLMDMISKIEGEKRRGAEEHREVLSLLEHIQGEVGEVYRNCSLLIEKSLLSLQERMGSGQEQIEKRVEVVEHVAKDCHHFLQFQQSILESQFKSHPLFLSLQRGVEQMEMSSKEVNDLREEVHRIEGSLLKVQSQQVGYEEYVKVREQVQSLRDIGGHYKEIRERTVEIAEQYQLIVGKMQLATDRLEADHGEVKEMRGLVLTLQKEVLPHLPNHYALKGEVERSLERSVAVQRDISSLRDLVGSVSNKLQQTENKIFLLRQGEVRGVEEKCREMEKKIEHIERRNSKRSREETKVGEKVSSLSPKGELRRSGGTKEREKVSGARGDRSPALGRSNTMPSLSRKDTVGIDRRGDMDSVEEIPTIPSLLASEPKEVESPRPPVRSPMQPVQIARRDTQERSRPFFPSSSPSPPPQLLPSSPRKPLSHNYLSSSSDSENEKEEKEEQTRKEVGEERVVRESAKERKSARERFSDSDSDPSPAPVSSANDKKNILITASAPFLSITHPPNNNGNAASERRTEEEGDLMADWDEESGEESGEDLVEKSVRSPAVPSPFKTAEPVVAPSDPAPEEGSGSLSPAPGGSFRERLRQRQGALQTHRVAHQMEGTNTSVLSDSLTDMLNDSASSPQKDPKAAQGNKEAGDAPGREGDDIFKIQKNDDKSSVLGDTSRRIARESSSGEDSDGAGGGGGGKAFEAPKPVRRVSLKSSVHMNKGKMSMEDSDSDSNSERMRTALRRSAARGRDIESSQEGDMVMSFEDNLSGDD